MKKQKRNRSYKNPSYERDTKSPESYSRYRFRSRSPSRSRTNDNGDRKYSSDNRKAK